MCVTHRRTTGPCLDPETDRITGRDLWDLLGVGEDDFRHLSRRTIRVDVPVVEEVPS